MTEHDLKVWPEYYEAIEADLKPFEIRKNDRDYQIGDVLSVNDPTRRQFNELACKTAGMQRERMKHI